MTKIDYLRKINYSNKGLAIYFNAKNMTVLRFNYIINSMDVKSNPEINNIMFLNTKSFFWEDTEESLKNMLLELEQQEIVFMSVNSFELTEKQVKLIVGKFLS